MYNMQAIVINNIFYALLVGASAKAYHCPQ